MIFGNLPTSTYLTEVRKLPTGTLFSCLQAVVQAWQPMQVSWLMTNPYRKAEGFYFGVRWPCHRFNRAPKKNKSGGAATALHDYLIANRLSANPAFTFSPVSSVTPATFPSTFFTVARVGIQIPSC